MANLELEYKKKSFYEVASDEEKQAAKDYAVGYMAYLDASKTEREAVITSVAMAEKNGYIPYSFGDKIVAGGKYYLNNRGKSLYLFKVGTESPENGVKIMAAHIDSPRLDLKPCPLYEDGGMGFLKTHYYGGVRKYQWTAIPLALHGVVCKADGTNVNIVIGEDDSDPLFYINDLLPHLAQDYNTKPLGTAISGETLNLLSGSAPVEGEDIANPIKLQILSILNEKYGITEADFMSAELSAVPAFKARDVGLDRSLIGSYGHDDRVCAYPALTALFGSDNTKDTVFVVLADKEETGSDGNTGMQSRILVDLIDELAAATGKNVNRIRANSSCLSADVTAAFDPNFADVYEKRNAALISCGVTLMKYTGSRGKASTNDATAEFVAKIRGIMEKEGVCFQMGELGKIDIGGGGTVAKFISVHNIDTVDIGVPVISMHAPYEIISKADLYTCHQAFAAYIK